MRQAGGHAQSKTTLASAGFPHTMLQVGPRRMNRKAIIRAVAPAAVIFLLGGACVTSPLRRSEADVRNWALRKAPLGSSVAEVKALIDRQRWRLDFEWRGTNSHATPRDYPYVRGGHIIGAYFGHYQGIPWRADVDAFWGFDDDGRLIDFYVRKCYDAL